MIVKEKFVKIIDFGMAKKVNLAYSPQMDCSTTVVGTLPYMVRAKLCFLLIISFVCIHSPIYGSNPNLVGSRNLYPENTCSNTLFCSEYYFKANIVKKNFLLNLNLVISFQFFYEFLLYTLKP